jgi:hypothetical protein
MSAHETSPFGKQDIDAGASKAWLRYGFARTRTWTLYPCIIMATPTPSFSTVMPTPAHDDPDVNDLHSVIEHVFMPPKLPQKHPGGEIEQKINVALCDNLIEAAQDFLRNIPSSRSSLWMRMIKMMESARRAATVPFVEAELQHVLSDMTIGGTCA